VISPSIPKSVSRRVHSALWAAWADALGFITELANESLVSRRLSGRPLDGPLPWTRRIGGRFGVEVNLPAGTYSDDTQLRLCVGRAIRASGFDVEAFAKVELPVWTSYALGGGNATKSAASNIASQSVPWFANFFDGWTNAGGNGAAMRIHPHVWASRTLLKGDYLGDLLADAIVTHGHPRALVGATFHSICLAATLDHGSVPTPSEWQELVALTLDAADAINTHVEVSDVWLPRWREASSKPWNEGWQAAVREIEEMLAAATAFVEGNRDCAPDFRLYLNLLDSLDGRSSKTRGSGTLTAVLALALATVGSDDPAAALKLSAMATDSDTDTVATMAGALIGASCNRPPPSPVVDQTYIASEAQRLGLIAEGQDAPEGFRYPDLLRWTPPRNQSDAVGLADGTHAIAGLGKFRAPLKSAGERNNAVWSWGITQFGQTLLVKHREDLPVMAGTQLPRSPDMDTLPRPEQVSAGLPRASQPRSVRVTFEPEGASRAKVDSAVGSQRTDRPNAAGLVNIDDVLKWLRERNYEDAALGYALRRVAERGTMADLATFAAAIRQDLTKVPRVSVPEVSNLPHISEDGITLLQAFNQLEALLRAVVKLRRNLTEPGIQANGIKGLITEALRRGVLSTEDANDLLPILHERNRLVHSGELPLEGIGESLRKLLRVSYRLEAVVAAAEAERPRLF
jgi:ADP-ribosylglycohydrolase